MRPDYIDIVEAAYRVDADEASWLESLAASMRPTLDRGLGLWIVLYDASAERHARIRAIEHTGPVPGFLPGLVTRLLHEAHADDDGRVEFGPAPCALASEASGAGHAQELLSELRPLGVADVLGVHGADPEGRGVFIGVNLPSPMRLGARQRELWSRVAAHAAAGWRLRTRLAAAEAHTREPLGDTEALIEPDGTVVEKAPGAAEPAARRALREAAVALERSRGRLRRERPEAAVAGWRGLVAARWTLLDVFDRDGRRYLVARRNDPEPEGLQSLTPRERQVVGYAALGHQNKLIAYELGLATSTVGVLLSRAFAKLGVKDRRALIALVRGRA
jgi:DNA-binding CsgD family transcriptional regulator